LKWDINGRIDDARIWIRVLSEIAELYSDRWVIFQDPYPFKSVVAVEDIARH
jgi:hypothetical protein